MSKLINYRLNFPNDKREFLPIIIGGMGVDISTDKLALKAAEIGAIGHITDAMNPTVTDRIYKTSFVKDKYEKYKYNKASFDKEIVQFSLEDVEESARIYISNTMSRKKGDGMIFINCMEKLTMNNPLGTLKARLDGALNAGVDGVTLSAGLHLSSVGLIKDNPRFRDVKIGIIVSSLRAFKLFLNRCNKLQRLPDYVVVEGPLAGGHLGFGMDWMNYDLKTIVDEIVAYLKKEELLSKIPVIPAGGIFTGTEGVDYLNSGSSAIQVATRFTISNECGLPDRVKQKYLLSNEEDVIVSGISPTGYPMRVLSNSPGLGSGIRPNCESYGYLLDKNGRCAYIDAYKEALAANNNDEKNLSVKDKVCLCTHMKTFKIWTCGHNVYRLKDTTNQLSDGSYQLPDASHLLNDYLHSENHSVSKPNLPETPTQITSSVAS